MPGLPGADHPHRLEPLLDHFADHRDGVVEPGDDHQNVRIGGLGLGDLDREVLGLRVVGDEVLDFVRNAHLRGERLDAAEHGAAEGVVDVHQHRRLRRRPRRREHIVHRLEATGDQHAACREVADDELVALLGDLRVGGDVDDERDALLLGDLGNRRGGARIEAADEHVGAFADQLLGLGTADIRIGFRVGGHQFDLVPHVREDGQREIGAALARLADEREVARPRQQDSDFQGLRRPQPADRHRRRKRGRTGSGKIAAASDGTRGPGERVSHDFAPHLDGVDCSDFGLLTVLRGVVTSIGQPAIPRQIRLAEPAIPHL